MGRGFESLVRHQSYFCPNHLSAIAYDRSTTATETERLGPQGMGRGLECLRGVRVSWGEALAGKSATTPPWRYTRCANDVDSWWPNSILPGLPTRSRPQEVPAAPREPCNILANGSERLEERLVFNAVSH